MNRSNEETPGVQGLQIIDADEESSKGSAAAVRPPSVSPRTSSPQAGPISIEEPAEPVAAVPADHGDERHARLLIIGSGPAGLTAAIYAARADLAPIVIAGFVPGGQLMITSEVENFPGFPEGIDGPDLMGRMRAQAERFGARLHDVDVESVDFSGRPFVVTAGGTRYSADAVVVATGASAIWLELENETRLRGRGVSACATCDGFFFRDRKIAVVGGGDSALEEALFLTKFAREVTILHRRDEFRGSRIMQNRVLAHPRISVQWNSQVVDVLGEEKISGLRIRDTDTGEEREEAVEGLFVAIGHKPNTEVFRDWLEVDAKGYLAVHDHTRTAVDGVFVAGDVHDHRYRQAITAAGDGCKAALDAERWLEEQAELEEQAGEADAGVSPAGQAVSVA